MKKLSLVVLTTFGITFAQFASAHAVVKPAQTGIATFQTFTLEIPSEKTAPTTAVRLLLPDGLNYVSPNVKPGWTIAVKKDGDKKTEIDWNGGTIPGEQRDELIFSAQVPSTQTVLAWKVYQTYADGSVVSWDQEPGQSKTDTDFANKGPYSTTKVVDDIAVTPPTPAADTSKPSSNLALTISIVALVLAAMANYRKRKA